MRLARPSEGERSALIAQSDPRVVSEPHLRMVVGEARSASEIAPYRSVRGCEHRRIAAHQWLSATAGRRLLCRPTEIKALQRSRRHESRGSCITRSVVTDLHDVTTSKAPLRRGRLLFVLQVRFRCVAPVRHLVSDACREMLLEHLYSKPWNTVTNELIQFCGEWENTKRKSVVIENPVLTLTSTTNKRQSTEATKTNQINALKNSANR